MNECIKTTLKREASDATIPLLGELVFNVTTNYTKPESDSNIAKNLIIACAETVTISIIGEGFINGTLKEITLDSNVYRTLTFSDGNYSVKISNKYAIRHFELTHPMFVLDMYYFRYSVYVTNLKLYSTTVHGDISILEKLQGLQYLDFSKNTELTGDIGYISNIPSINTIILTNSHISGNISKLSKCINLNKLTIDKNENIFGDITSLNSLTKLQNFNIDNTNKIYGDISSLYGNIRSWNGQVALEWKNTRPSTMKILGINNIDLGNSLDKMLIDQSACIQNSVNTVINVYGTRTSASDTAISNLKSKGCVITVNGVSL